MCIVTSPTADYLYAREKKNRICLAMLQLGSWAGALVLSFKCIFFKKFQILIPNEYEIAEAETYKHRLVKC